jgi:hypothetical protein
MFGHVLCSIKNIKSGYGVVGGINPNVWFRYCILHRILKMVMVLWAAHTLMFGHVLYFI